MSIKLEQSTRRVHYNHKNNGFSIAIPNISVRRNRLVSFISAALIASSEIFSTQAYAQNITGGLHGLAPQGVTVEVTAPAIGFSKTLTVGSKGEYDLSQLNPGAYVVKIIGKDGHDLGSVPVQIKPNITAAVPNLAASAAAKANGTQTMNEVTVTGQSFQVTTPIDVSTPELVNNYSAELVHDLPIDQTYLESVYNLQSGAKTFGGYWQVNGASVAENRRYYNEFDMNNDIVGLAGNFAISFRQDAVADTQVINGSGGLAWTSTTGGIVSGTLKEGSNDFHGGYTAIITPATSRLLDPRGDDEWYTPLGTSTPTYSLYQSANHNGAGLNQDVWASGPIVPDKLFFFVMLANQPPISKSDTYYTNQMNQYSSRDKTWMTNLTWKINDDQSLNIAGQRDWISGSTNTYQMSENYEPSSVTGAPQWSGGLWRQKIGIANYHWRITDDLSFRAMAGYTRYDNISEYSTPLSVPLINTYDYNTGLSENYGSPNSTNYGTTTYVRRGYKADVNWTIGDHTLTAGFDRYSNTYGYTPTWWPSWYYTFNEPVSYGPLSNGSPIPASGNYVTSYNGYFGGDFNTSAYGEYLYDTWKVTDTVVLTGGVRWDHMQNMEGDGAMFLDLHSLSPRVGAAWDVHGDSSMKLGLNIGKYTLPMPSNLNYMIAGYSCASESFYTYTGIDPTTHIPIGLSQIGSTYVFPWGSCQMPNPSMLTAANLKNTSQRNIQIYMQQQLSPAWQFNAKFDANHLDNIIDSISDSTGFITSYVQSHGYPNFSRIGGSSQQVLFNPGRSIVLRGNLAGNGQIQSITIPNSYLGMPNPSRNYYDLDFQLEHPRTDDEPYYLSLNYTWAHLYGNIDGYANESRAPVNGNWSFGEGESGNFLYSQLLPGSDGNLAADIRNKLVASGIYYWQNGLRVSSLFTAQTGAPYGCFGSYPDPAVMAANPSGLSGVTHYCNGGQLVPLNGLGRYPFSWRLDVGIGYGWQINDNNKVDISLNVTNLTNRQAVTALNTQANSGTGPAPDQNYLSISALQPPRSTNLVVRYSF
jgi:hypothetical protein